MNITMLPNNVLAIIVVCEDSKLARQSPKVSSAGSLYINDP